MPTLTHRLALGSVAAAAGFLFTLAPANAGDSPREPLLTGDRTVAAGREGGPVVVSAPDTGVNPATVTLGLVSAGFGVAVARSLYLRRLELEPMRAS